MCGFFRRMLGRRADAEDLVQEVFVRVVHAIHGYREDGRFEAWLFRVAADGMFFQTTVLLRWIVFLGFAVALGGIGLAVYDVIAYFGYENPSGYTSLAVLILVLGGLILTSMGVIGLYVGRIFGQVKERPLYVVDDTVERSREEDVLEHPFDAVTAPNDS